MNKLLSILVLCIAFPLLGIAQPAWLNDGLVAYYPFDGDAKDYSGNELDGNAESITYANRIPNNNSAQFNGETSRVFINDSNHAFDFPVEGSFSVAFWAKFSRQEITYFLGKNEGSGMMNKWLVGYGSTNGHDPSVSDDTKRLFFHFGSAGGGLWYATKTGENLLLNDGTWHHVVLARAGGRLVFYVNSEMVGLIQGVAMFPESFELNAPVEIGASEGNGFDGMLDEVRLYNRALSATEVAELYEYESTPPARPIEEWIDDGLVAYYPFDGDVKDYSGNGNDGIVEGELYYRKDKHGVANRAISFAGDGNKVVVAESSLALSPEDGASFSLWLRYDSNQLQHVFGMRHPESHLSNYQLFITPSEIGFGGSGFEDFIANIENLATHDWYHVMVSADIKETVFYINGVASHRKDGQRFSNEIDTEFTLGTSGIFEEYDGDVDNLRIYNRALSATEVAELYEYESTPPARPIEEWIDDGLVAYYPFDGDFQDATGNLSNTQVEGEVLINSLGQAEFSPDSFLATPNGFPTGSQPRTISVWASSTGEGTQVLFSYGSTEQQKRFGVGLNFRGYGGVFAEIAFSVASRQFEFDASSLNHYVFSYSKGQALNTVKMYVNGVSAGNINYQEFAERIPDTSDLRWGVFGGHYKDGVVIPGFVGAMDNARIYSRALSATEVAQLHAYESQPPSSTRKASAMAQIVNGFIVGAEVLDGGYGYSSNPEVTISGGGGFGAVATATVSAGKVVKINIINPGFGYTGDPTIDIAAPPVPPALAFATAEVVNGFLVGTLLVTGGDGYTEPPAVKVTGGNGQGAVLATEIANGRVVAVNVINPGSGYTTAPVITIAPPPTAPELSIRVTQVEVNMKLTEGKRYTIESSKNMVDWTQTGPLFVAEEQFMAVKFDVDEFGQFFRVIEQP